MCPLKYGVLYKYQQAMPSPNTSEVLTLNGTLQFYSFSRVVCTLGLSTYHHNLNSLLATIFVYNDQIKSIGIVFHSFYVYIYIHDTEAM